MSSLRKSLIGVVLLSIIAVLPLMNSYKKKRLFTKQILLAPFKNSSEEPSEQILSYLDQTYTFLGKGQEMMAFISEDKKWVIKIPRKKGKGAFWQKLASIEKRNPKMKQEGRILSEFMRAKEYLSDASAIFYEHFGKTQTLEKKITLIDEKSVKHKLDLNTLPFYIQAYHTLFGDVIKESVKKSDIESFKRASYAFFEMIGTRHAKGLKKTDKMQWWKNYGITKNFRVIEIDLGGIYHERGEYSEELLRYKKLIESWVQENTPLEFQKGFEEEYAKAAKIPPNEHLLNYQKRR